MLIRSKENTVHVTFANGKEGQFIRGTTLLEMLEYNRPENMEDIRLANVNRRPQNLLLPVDQDCIIEWLSETTIEAKRANQQTLCLVLIRAVSELYPNEKLLIDHSLGKGLFCQLKNNKPLRKQMVKKIKKRMLELIEIDTAIIPTTLPRQQALDYMEQKGESPLWLEGNRELCDLTLYQYGTHLEYLGSPLFHTSKLLSQFDLVYWKPGFVLVVPEDGEPLSSAKAIRQSRLFKVFHEYGHWEDILGASKVADINKAVQDGRIYDLVKIAEGLHEKKIASIADVIEAKRKHLRIVLIAGPSSSGKTTFAKRLNIQLRVNGLRPLSLSLDDYFLDRDETPKDKDGNYDFESIRAIDIPRFTRDLEQLLSGQEIRLPVFDFKEGRKVPGALVHLEPHQPILIEGLHCLNDQLTAAFSKRSKLKLYVSALTQLNITDHLRVPTSDVRLLRRLVRDNNFRGYTAEHTLKQWSLVRKGEEVHIFPFQENADIIFNTSLMYELCVLQKFARPLLEGVPPEHPLYSEARRLLELHLNFMSIPQHVVPNNSLLREFIGGSSFSY